MKSNSEAVKRCEGKREMNREELRDKARKKIIAVAIVGAVLITTDVAMSGGSDGIRLVSSGGQIYMIRPSEKEGSAHMQMKARVESEKGTIEKNISISLSPYDSSGGDKEKKEEVLSKEEEIEYELRNIGKDFNRNTDERKVLLPTELDTGEKITWERKKSSNTVPVLCLVLLAMAVIYKDRFKEIEKERRRNQASVIRQLPEFVNRLVLLLNAGLVLNSAFEKSIEESAGFRNNEKDYFYGKLRGIYILSKNTNSSLHREFRRFAKESGMKELVRISNIINDNVSKGVELTDKLQAESEMLWLNRRKSCEEKGRLAETKLTLPLVIFLMVLIGITVAPALLEI